MNEQPSAPAPLVIEVVDAHERAEAALGWFEDEASSARASGPDWADQACEELAAGSATGKLLGSA